MTPAAIGERAQRVAAARSASVVSSRSVSAALVDVRAIRAWADAQEAALVTRLASVSAFPESDIAEANRCSLGAATKTKERADTLSSTPALADALGDGDITAAHVDAVTRASKKLDDADQRAALLDRADALTDIATVGTVGDFGRRLDLEVRKLQSDDGEARLTRQRRDTRLNTWVDLDGMWNIRGRFDPVSGVRLQGKLTSACNALFAQSTPDLCPSDPIEKQKFLDAHALISIVDGHDTATGLTDAANGTPSIARRPEYVAVIDADMPDGAGPHVEFAIPIELPARVIAELADTGEVNAVLVGNGVVLHAPGNLNLGRSTRLANRAQRRALRSLYRDCAIPGCSVHFDRCKIHHIVWWRHGGPTDLDNLLPICARHHAKVHDGGWVVELGPNRELTLSRPDGSVRTTGPPNRRTAA